MKFKNHDVYDEPTPPHEGEWVEVHSLKDILDIAYPGGLIKARGHMAQVHFKSEWFIQAAHEAHEFCGYTYVGYLLEYYEPGKWCVRGFVDEIPDKDEYAIWNQEMGDWEIKEHAPHRF